MPIETWVTTPAGVYVAHVERSVSSPFRSFRASRILGAAGMGSLEYHVDNALVAGMPGLLELGNLVWMRYRDRTITWVIESSSDKLDASERASEWVTVSGRGVRVLASDRLIWPTSFTDPPTAPKGWPTQYRTFTGRAVGEMVWDLLAESNPRFATALVRGTIETDPAEMWTANFRFERIGDVLDAVEKAFGWVVFDGLAVSYYNDLGIDRSDSVIFEQGADLVSLEHDADDRERVSWVVAQGAGEGVFASLATAADPSPPGRRREAFVDAKSAGNPALLAIAASSAIAEHGRRETFGFEFVETRYEAFRDFDLGDTVRAIAPSRGLAAHARVVAIYLADEHDRVRTVVDLGAPRLAGETKLAEAQKVAAQSLSVLNRLPQGQLVPFSFSGADVFDSVDTMDVFLLVPSRMYVLVEARAVVRFREFFTGAKASTSASGVQTSDDGGGATSGASSASSSGGSSDNTSGSSPHTHDIAFTTGSPGGKTLRQFSTFLGEFDLETNFTGMWETDTEGAGGHYHGMAHTHGIAHHHSTPDHDHTIPSHTHNLTYGVFKEAYPASHSVTIKVYELVASAWTLRQTIAAQMADVLDLDLTSSIVGPGSWRIELRSDAAQPNGGRLGCDVAGYVLGAIQSE